MKKKILSLALAGILLVLSACGTLPSGEDAKSDGSSVGRYVEKDISPPVEGRFTSFVTAEGTLVCFDEGLGTRYESRDNGASWSEQPGPGDGSARYHRMQASALLPDGQLLVYLQDEGLLLIRPDGSSTPYPMPELDEALAAGEMVMLSKLQVLSDARLLLGYTILSGMTIISPDSSEAGPIIEDGADIDGEETSDGAELEVSGSTMDGGPISVGGISIGGGSISLGSGGSFGGMNAKLLLCELETGAVVAELAQEDIGAAAADTDTLYVMDMNGNLKAYALDSGAALPGEKRSFGSSMGLGGFGIMLGSSGGSTLALGTDGTLYTARNSSLLKADAEGVVSTLLEGSACSLGTPSSSPEAVLALANGTLAVNLLEAGQRSRLYTYTWDENATVDPGKTLSVWSLKDNALVRAAIAELRKKHPDASISYEAALDGDNALEAADAIKSLNTRLLNGSGPDVLLLDGCPVESYADKGMLLSLTELVDTDDMFDNLLTPYKNGGDLYCLPTQFLMPALMGGGDTLDALQTLEDLVGLAVSGNDLPSGGGFLGGGIAEEDRAVISFNDLRELFDVLWLSGAPAIAADNRLDTDALRSLLTAVKALSDKLELTKDSDFGQSAIGISIVGGGTMTVLPGSLVSYTSRMTLCGAFNAANLSLLQMTTGQENSQLKLFPGLTEGAWRPAAMVGVSADTSVKEFAAELVQTMLSPAIQGLNYSTGLPITQKGLELQAEEINARLREMEQPPFEFDMAALAAQLTTPSAEDTVLTEMVWAGVQRCCRGETDIEGAVREIEQSIKNYLAERA